jgi:preprotein translocase subunit SecD
MRGCDGGILWQLRAGFTAPSSTRKHHLRRQRIIVRRQVLNALALTILVTALAIWIDFFPSSFKTALGRDVSTKLGLDLQGGAQIFLKPEPGVSPTKEQVEQAAGVIERRVGGIGVSEAVVQVVNGDSIIVELPGVKNPEEASASIKGAGNLEFIDPRGEYLAEGTEVCTTVTPRYPAPLPVINPTGTNGLTGTNPLSPTDGLSGTNSLSPTTDLGATAPITQSDRPCTDPYTTIAKGTDLDTGQVALSADQAGQPAVRFVFRDESASQISTFTAQNIGRPMSIVVDNRVISSPQVNGTLPGEGIITFGSQTRSQQEAEARILLNQLRFGALPFTLVEDSNRTISATLGDDSIQASTLAGAIGLIVVMIFMLIYYRLPGMIANIALIIYSLVSFAVYKLIPVTLTLPGIAGFILSIGLAVDANVLIFARIKEELLRGRSLDRAVEEGFRHAWPSIRDSNASTLITSFILYVLGNSFGVSIIQGFALTLALGIIVSLFSAITVSRMLLRLMIDLGLSSPRWFGVKTNDETHAVMEQA